ncbi:MAG: divergent polysaccharide deacetylase family protein [Candidatus Omnitrophota bacterium]
MNLREKNKFLLFAVLALAFVVVVEGGLLVRFWPRRPKKEPAKIAPRFPSPPKVKIEKAAKIAIIIDDWGYNLRNEQFLKNFKYPVTVAILPHLPYSGRIASLAKKYNHEIILHLPMEPHEREEIRLEKEVIFTGMDEKTIVRTLNNALKSVPNASGINNHMGSKATEDKRVMSVLFREFKKRKMYFLDSMVTPNSVGEELAEKSGVKFAQRNIFLDNQSDYQYIAGQLRSLVNKARNNGFAVGVGHDRPLTLQVIQELVPSFIEEGVEFVFVSDLVK